MLEHAQQPATNTNVARTLTIGQRTVLAADRGIYFVASHWLALTNLMFTGFVLACVAAPLLAAGGYQSVANPIYRFAGLFCHQRDDRSFHLRGFPIAVCERCFAIYAGMAIVALVFTILHGKLRKPEWWELIVLLMPALIDGFAQMVGLWESTTATRVLSGAMLGWAIGWFLLPYLDRGFAAIRSQIENLFARLNAAGLVRPL